MNVRIVAGRYGGRIIQGSGTNRTHPMSERIKNAIFNSLGSRIDGATVLDAFAGSGALGLEALSRGAQSAVFIEKDRVAQRIIEDNISLLKLTEAEVKLIKAPVASATDTLQQKFSIIFADPPYHDPQLATIIRLFSLLDEQGVLVLSHPEKAALEVPSGYVRIDSRVYGNACISYYQAQ